MQKRATIKDIAEKAGVSSGTVHRALYGKSGVGEAARAQILEIAASCGYRPNYVASSLKRKTLRFLAAFPVPTERNRFYYTHVWHGFRDYMHEMGDYNIEVIELPFHSPEHQAAELDCAYQRYDGEIDGLLTVGCTNERTSSVVGKYIAAGIPVVLACDDMQDSGRLCCVQANYDVTGRMAAELLSSQLRGNERVLVCAGDVIVSSHCKVVQGFSDYLRENGELISASIVYGYSDEEQVRVRLMEEIGSGAYAAVFSVTARGSVLAAEVVRELGLMGRIRLVTSDIFPENVKNMRDGVVSNILFKDPYRQAYLGAKILMGYVIRGEQPAVETRYVDSVMIFRSNL